MEVPTTIQTTSDLHVEPVERNLREDFVRAYGPDIFLGLTILGTLVLLPFSIGNFVQDRPLIGAATSMVVLCLLVDAWAISRGHKAPIPVAFLFCPVLLGLADAMYEKGLIGILWAYPALLLFHFVLPRYMANIFNVLIIGMAVATSWFMLGPDITLRVGVTLPLVLLFTNVFSSIGEAQQRKESEQRQRLDLVVRGTNAGTVEWQGDKPLHYSRRFRQMVGRPADADTTRWNFYDFVHAGDRERVHVALAAQLRQVGRPRSVRHQPPDEFRLVHASGRPVWVHAEGIAVSDRHGRVERYIYSFMDISERVHAEEALLRSHEQVREQARQLEAQNRTLREAIRVREEVERMARHDLKTPLSSIASVPRLMREGRNLDPRQEDLMGMVERAALRVLSLVNLSLDLYRMEEGSYRLRAQAVDVAGVVKTVARELQDHARSKRLAIRLDLPSGPVLTCGEELLCYSIVANLMKNAVEAAPEGTRLTVKSEEGHWNRQAAIGIHIHNEGAVPAPVRAKFFEKYSTHGKAGGTGLGAYSARLMARIQEGELLMATDDRFGTTLSLWLPRWLAQAPTHTDDDATMPLFRKPSRRTVPALSLLLVDDDEYNTTVLRSLLPSPPLDIRIAVNGRAALDRVAEARPDVIFLDLEMPVMGGVETVARLRELQRELKQAPSTIVAFSAHDDEATRMRCLVAGFDLYLAKPTTREEVLTLLRGERPAPPPAVRGKPPAAALPEDESDLVWVDEEVSHLVPAFLESRRVMAQQLIEAAGSGERMAVRALAHKMAGGLASYGFERASRACRDIEARSDSPDWDDVRRRCVEVAAQLDRVRVHSRVSMPAPLL